MDDRDDALAATVRGTPPAGLAPAAGGGARDASGPASATPDPAAAAPLLGPTPPGRRDATPEQAANALAAAAALAPGHRLGHFEIVRLIGTGGMGAVYLARDLSLEREVALKVIAAGMLGPDDALAGRFVREARTQARLSHPNVVQIYFIGEERGLRFFAMELVDGPTLEDLLAERGALPWSDVLEILLGVTRALQAAHGQGLVHRDLKPSNLLVRRDAPPGEVKVADFGLAKWVDQTPAEANLTAQGVILGTPRYMSPEQALGESTDHRSDIYSLGAAAFHLLTGRPPFEAVTPMALAAKHITETPPPLASCCRDPLPPSLAHVVTRMLAKRPAARYQTHAELIQALEGARAAALAPAGFWVRGVATLVDVTFIAALCYAVNLWMLLLYPVYYVLLHRLHRGRSLGKRLLGLRVHTVDGRVPSTPRLVLRATVAVWGAALALGLAAHRVDMVRPATHAIWRVERDAFDTALRRDASPAFDTTLRLRIYRVLWDQRGVLVCAYWPSALFFALTVLGLLVAAFDRQRRALHDIVAGTLVTHDAAPRPPPSG